MKNDASYEAIMQLCEMGRIKVSIYNGARTAARYLLDRIDSGNFYFSLISAGNEDATLLDKIHDAIKYSDVGVLKECMENASSKEEEEQYRFLYRYAELILLLSRNANATLEEKNTSMKSLLDYLDIVKTVFCQENEINNHIASGLKVLENIKETEEHAKLYSRSKWYELLGKCQGEGVAEGEAIIDLCYNYALEDSISNVDKRYENGNLKSFQKSFAKEFASYWKLIEEKNHTIHSQDEETADSIDLFFEKSMQVDWVAAMHMIRRNLAYVEQFQKVKKEDCPEDSREIRMTAQQKYWKNVTRFSLFQRIMILIAYIILFTLVTYVINEVQSLLLGDLLDQLNVWGQFLTNLVSIIVFGILTSLLFRNFDLPDILETLESIRQGLKEQRVLRKFKDKNLSGGL